MIKRSFVYKSQAIILQLYKSAIQVSCPTAPRILCMEASFTQRYQVNGSALYIKNDTRLQAHTI